MTAKILTGTYTAGYTLSAAYSSLTITASGRVFGAAGADGPAYAAGGAGGEGSFCRPAAASPITG